MNEQQEESPVRKKAIEEVYMTELTKSKGALHHSKVSPFSFGEEEVKQQSSQ